MNARQLRSGSLVLVPGKELRRDGVPLPIGHRAMLVLECLMEAEGEVVAKAALLERAWQGAAVEDGNLTVQIAALRKELGMRGDGGEWITTVPRVGYRFVGDGARASPAEERDSGLPRLAVLPFLNLSTDPQNDYFADGLVADLITALSRFRSFAVVSRTSSFAFKNQAVDAREVAERLGVRYLLEGSVRLAGQQVRVTTQLIDAKTGTHLWATSLDGDLGDVFAFQDRVTESVVGLVEPQIRKVEIERARRRPPGSPQAYDYFLRAMPHFHSRRPSDYTTALTLLDQAIALEPDYPMALAYASWGLVRRGTVSLEFLTPDEADRCIALARQALALGGDDPTVMAIAAHSLVTIEHKRAEGLAIARRAMEANPNNVVVLMLVGITNVLAGDLDLAGEVYERAYRLCPGGQEAYECLTGIGHSLFYKRDFAQATQWLEQSLATLVDWPPTYWLLAASQAHLGQVELARETLERVLKLAPHTSLEALQVIGARMDDRFSLLVDGLRLAGLK